MSAVHRIHSLIRPVAAGTLAAAVLVLSGAAPAKAAPAAHRAPAVPRAYSAAQIAAARAVAGSDSTLDVLRRFFAAAPDHAIRATASPRAAGARAAPHLTGSGTTVYTLNADFVAGREDVPVAEPAFVAIDAVSATGRLASVWTARTGRGWQVVNIASGAAETTYAAKADGRGTVFREPRINAWYLLRGDRVLPLDAGARAVVGEHGTSVARYRHHVRASYASRPPGRRTTGTATPAAPARRPPGRPPRPAGRPEVRYGRHHPGRPGRGRCRAHPGPRPHRATANRRPRSAVTWPHRVPRGARGTTAPHVVGTHPGWVRGTAPTGPGPTPETGPGRPTQDPGHRERRPPHRRGSPRRMRPGTGPHDRPGPPRPACRRIGTSGPRSAGRRPREPGLGRCPPHRVPFGPGGGLCGRPGSP
ncbi:hypothetical protein H4K36_26255 [Streptomyces sp. DHE7-1]|nr:hypothetical protein [Streptomyces sp. DHE7-1]